MVDLTVEERVFYGKRSDAGFIKADSAADTRRDAGEGLAVASEMIAIEAARTVIADAMEILLDRVRASERAAHTDDRRLTLQEQYSALVSGVEDVLAEMGDSVNSE